MPNCLRNVRVKKVDFVDAGANPEANIMLFKRREPPGEKESGMKRFFASVAKKLGIEEVQAEEAADEILKAQEESIGEWIPVSAAAEENREPEGAVAEMKIDKSKLTPEEAAALDAIEKKAGIPEDPVSGESETKTVSTKKSVEPTADATDEEDIYKGLHPAVKAELERLRKQADAIEERELTEVAKKYEIIGKKAEELVPVLKNLKAAGGEAYEQMLTVLDASVEAVEKSGLFREIGKSGGNTSDPWNAIEKKAEEIQKSMPSLNWNQAIDKACEMHPELVHEYESEI